MDPPYRKDMGDTALAAADSGGWLAPGAFIVWEEAQPMTAPAGFDLQDQRRYGDTWITLMSKHGG
jgi:16S rRNA (guanine966-N2)-methyltransferase